jgi:UDP-glucose 4-epimerase
MRDRRVLVTGGGGFIGSHLVDALATQDTTGEVLVVDDFSVGSPTNVQATGRSATIRVIEADVRDRQAMRDLMRGVSVVYHLATQCLRVSLVDPQLVSDVNVKGTLNVLEAATKAGVSRFVYVSSSEVYGTARTLPMAESHHCVPTTIYGASKLAGELYARAFHTVHRLPVVIVRPFNTYGPRSHFEGLYGEVLPKFVLRVLAGQPPIIYGDGEQTRDFTFVADTVRGIMLATECDALIGCPVNIARGEEISINRLAALVVDAIGASVEPMHQPARPGDVRRHRADVRLARRLLKYVPQVSIQEGVAQYIEWFRQTYPDLRRALASEETYDWKPVGEMNRHG